MLIEEGDQLVCSPVEGGALASPKRHLHWIVPLLKLRVVGMCSRGEARYI